jgi:hypothetical protein
MTVERVDGTFKGLSCGRDFARFEGDKANGSLSSPPHSIVNGVLGDEGGIEFGIFAPSACNVGEITLLARLWGNGDATSQHLNCHFVQALALFPGSAAKCPVEVARDIADRVLHALIVGNAGMLCEARKMGRLDGRRARDPSARW